MFVSDTLSFDLNIWYVVMMQRYRWASDWQKGNLMNQIENKPKDSKYKKTYTFTANENVILKLNTFIGYRSRSSLIESLISDYIKSKGESI